jgi:hypothetical protein
MRLIRLIPCLLVFGSLAIACGGSSDSTNKGAGGDGSGAETGVTLEELPAKYAETFCQVFTGCVGALYDIYRPGEECLKGIEPGIE